MGFFEDRRNEMFSLMDENSALLIYSGVPKILSADEEYPFVPNKNFYYLTGLKQDNSALLLVKGIGYKKTHIFIDDFDAVKEKWTGKRLTFDDARLFSECSNIYSSNSLESILNLVFKIKDNTYGEIKKLYLDLTKELKIKEAYSTREFANDVKNMFPHITVYDCFGFFVKLRSKKTKEEINNLKEAINITNSGINDLIYFMKPGIKEFELSDRFEFYGRSHGRHGLSFSTISASGKNACTLHYPISIQNDTIENGDLVLLDLGFEHHMYNADVSRTYPVNGHFNEIQKKIYEAVLNCNKACIEYVHPGMTLVELNKFAVEFLRKECIRLELMNKDDDIRKYYYHAVSHPLGLDTHDIPSRNEPLQVGSVITIEPGLYFLEHKVGIRIEDDIVIQEKGNVVLTKNIAKEINDIERLFSQKEKL